MIHLCPKGKEEIDAPANAFLAAVDNCFLTFEHDSMKRKWYSCAYCKTNQMPAELYVGDVLDTSETMNMKPVKLWDMRKPQPIAQLSNRYETMHVSLCGLFSTTVKKASVSQYQHIGEVNSITKLDCHFHGMFGFLAVKEDDINVFADNPDSASRIKKHYHGTALTIIYIHPFTAIMRHSSVMSNLSLVVLILRF